MIHGYLRGCFRVKKIREFFKKQKNRFVLWYKETYYPVKLHTMNPVGRENMQREIDRYWNETK